MIVSMFSLELLLLIRGKDQLIFDPANRNPFMILAIIFVITAGGYFIGLYFRRMDVKKQDQSG